MVNLIDFIQLGVAGIAIIVIYMISKLFIDFIKVQEENNKKLIQNHLKSETKAKMKMNASFNQLAYSIQELLKWFKNNNGVK